MTARPLCEPVELPPGASVVVEHVTHPARSPKLGRLLHFHDVSELVLFDRVEGLFFAGGRRFQLGDGAIAFIPSMRHHDFELSSGEKSWLLVQIDPYLVERLAIQAPFARLSRPFCAMADAGQPDRIHMLADWLRQETARDPRDPLVVRIVEMLLIAVLAAPESQGCESPGDEANVERLLPAIERLRLDPKAPMSLEDAAAACNLSTAYFSRRFKHVFGLNYSDYARTYRLHLAARRIVSGNVAVSEIAYELGFASASHFTASFRRRFGLSPRDYRARARTRSPTT